MVSFSFSAESDGEIFVFVLVSAESGIPFSAQVLFSDKIVKSIFGRTLLPIT